ncbi:hypothetical protein [Novosphingobium sp. BL-52-GroH]|uniref:hypothetical protein n=1 Tax=Novosphingobium sp. BL-52-GroH TaxID=3349877 RepID=UPI00384F3181
MLASLSADPDPTAIGLDQLAPDVEALRIARPAVRQGWLEGRSRSGRGEEPFVEVEWDVALDLVASKRVRFPGSGSDNRSRLPVRGDT